MALPRLVLQVGYIVGAALSRALVTAYREASKGGASGAGALVRRKRMTADEARSILGVNVNAVRVEELTARFEKLNALNGPGPGFAGSPYLQRKISVARDILRQHLTDTKKVCSSSSSSATAAGNSSANDTTRRNL
eukprot:Selendium_serpulae@DN1842_c0_g1_i1.p1